MEHIISFIGMIFFIVLGFWIFLILKKEKQWAVNFLQDENVLFEELQKVKMTILGFKIILFYGVLFFVLAVCAFLEIRENFSSGLFSCFLFVTWLFLLLEIFFIGLNAAWLCLKVSKLYRYVCSNYVVEANVDKYKNGYWICKFSRHGEHLAYFSKKPSAKKIKALVIDYDRKLKMYLLQEM